MDDDLDSALMLLARVRLLGRVCRDFPLSQEETAACGETLMAAAERTSAILSKYLSA
jgi:hypothetical protein